MEYLKQSDMFCIPTDAKHKERQCAYLITVSNLQQSERQTVRTPDRNLGSKIFSVLSYFESSYDESKCTRKEGKTYEGYNTNVKFKLTGHLRPFPDLSPVCLHQRNGVLLTQYITSNCITLPGETSVAGLVRKVLIQSVLV